RRRIGPQHAQGMLTVGEITRQPSYAPVGSSLGPRDARHLASPLACRCGTVRGARRVKLLVTGGSGFIGSNFVRHVLATRPDDTVVNLDKLTYAGNPANLKDVERDPRYAFVHGDICDAKLVRDVARGVEDQLGVADVAVDEGVARIALDVLQVRRVARVGELVEVDDGVVGARREDVSNEVRADEAAPARDEQLHPPSPASRPTPTRQGRCKMTSSVRGLARDLAHGQHALGMLRTDPATTENEARRRQLASPYPRVTSHTSAPA